LSPATGWVRSSAARKRDVVDVTFDFRSDTPPGKTRTRSVCFMDARMRVCRGTAERVGSL
jgi:hypothetical protein